MAHQRGDLEAGENICTDVGRGAELSSDPFDIISTKNASIDILRRWRVRSLVSVFFLLLLLFCDL